MEPISTAIVSGLVAGVATDTAKIGKHAIVASYEALKTALRKKCGSNSDVIEAVEHLEKKPDAKTRQAGVAEEIKAAEVYKDEELIAAAKTLLLELKKIQTGQQTVPGINIIAERVGIAGNYAHVEGGIQLGDKHQ